MSQQGVSADMIPNSAVRTFSQKTEGAKRKTARVSWLPRKFRSLKILGYCKLTVYILLHRRDWIRNSIKIQLGPDKQREKLGLVWRNIKKISQIINDYLYLPFFFLIVCLSSSSPIPFMDLLKMFGTSSKVSLFCTTCYGYCGHFVLYNDLKLFKGYTPLNNFRSLILGRTLDRHSLLKYVFLLFINIFWSSLVVLSEEMWGMGNYLGSVSSEIVW